MTDFRDRFTKRHTFLTVVHAEHRQQVVRNVGVSVDNGADGAFLINHNMPPEVLLNCYSDARIKYPRFWLGLNILGVSQMDAVKRLSGYSCGLWVDNPAIRESGESPEAEAVKRERQILSSWRGIYFGGVAFKYQERVADPAKAAVRALPYLDVITTSGKATGSAPAIAKIKAMKEAIGEHPLAIASGITPENVEAYMPWSDCFLVATGISDSHTNLNALRVAQLANILSA